MNFILELLFPKRCLGCGKLGRYLCNSCLTKIPQPDPICPLCTRPSFDYRTHPICRRSFGLDGLISCFTYRSIISRAVKTIKYHWVSDMASVLGILLVARIEKHIQLENYIVVPVPLHHSRMTWRGFNQSEVIAQSLSNNLHIPFLPHALIRKIKTVPQVMLKKGDRSENVKGVFAFNTDVDVKGKNVLLIDDVWTTGSTLRECGKVLKQNGARSVWAVTIAR